MKSPVVKRSIVLAGHKTSVSLEDGFWEGLKVIARERHMSLSDLVTAIDTDRQHGNLSSALRLFVLEFYRGKVSAKLGEEMLHGVLVRPPPVLS
jgi:predicted DNA-binding ribbon-helix-helix protein